MNKALINRRLRQIHLWFGLGIGAQIGLWLISGLFMTLFPIEQVRGDQLRAQIPDQQLENMSRALQPSAMAALEGIAPQSLLLKTLDGQMVWYAKGKDTALLLDAQTGTQLSPIDEPFAIRLARSAYSGSGDVSHAKLYGDPPREYGRDGPVWRVDFSKPNAASFYVDATTGDVRAVRTGLWRTFDFMWGLHIMDWSSRENFNSWWIKMTASLAVLFFFTGFGLAVLRVSATIKRRRKQKGT